MWSALTSLISLRSVLLDIRRPITRTSPSNLFWGINQSIRFGSSTTILSNTAGIVDTGTTPTLIATGGSYPIAHAILAVTYR